MEFRLELSWEFLSADEIAVKTIRALRNHIKHAKECSAFYRTSLERFEPDAINSLGEFALLPLTERHHLADHSSKFLGVDPVQIAETVLTAASTGKPMPFVLTASDIDRIAFSNALSLHSMGISSADRVQILLSLDRFSIDGMAQYRGAIMAGANVMRLGAGVAVHSVMQKYLQFFRPTVLIGTPSSLLSTGQDLAKNGFDPAKCQVQKIVATSEPVWTKEMRYNGTGQQLADLWGAKVFSMYSATELSASFGDCECQSGAHAHPELVYIEIVDEKGKPVPDGTVGELVATPLGVEGVPLVRYKTGDMTFKINGTCACGRNSTRIGPVIGRKSQAFTCLGTTVFAANLINALDSVDEIKDYQIVLESDPRGNDSPTIHVAAPPAALVKISQIVKAATGVHIPALISNIPTIQAMRGTTGKRGSVLDHRGKPAAH